MTTVRDLRERIRREVLLGTTVGSAAPAVVEALAPAGFDVICLDSEHVAVGIDGIESMLRAADVTATPALVRVPEVGSDIGRVLDAGAAGVIVPRIGTVEEAREAVRRARYAPEGARGAGPGRGSSYGAALFEQVSAANRDVLVCVQIESRAGLAEVERIAAVPGLDVLMVGTFDLAVSLGRAPGSAEHESAIARVFEAGDRAGLALGNFCGDAEDVARNIARGVNLVLAGLDLGFIASSAIELAQAASAARAQLLTPVGSKS
jgi:2-keto-3-deoxy-L-rhamnonate aldolase RhmA